MVVCIILTALISSFLTLLVAGNYYYNRIKEIDNEMFDFFNQYYDNKTEGSAD